MARLPLQGRPTMRRAPTLGNHATQAVELWSTQGRRFVLRDSSHCRNVPRTSRGLVGSDVNSRTRSGVALDVVRWCSFPTSGTECWATGLQAVVAAGITGVVHELRVRIDSVGGHVAVLKLERADFIFVGQIIGVLVAGACISGFHKTVTAVVREDVVGNEAIVGPVSVRFVPRAYDQTGRAVIEDRVPRNLNVGCGMPQVNTIGTVVVNEVDENMATPIGVVDTMHLTARGCT